MNEDAHIASLKARIEALSVRVENLPQEVQEKSLQNSQNNSTK